MYGFVCVCVCVYVCVCVCERERERERERGREREREREKRDTHTEKHQIFPPIDGGAAGVILEIRECRKVLFVCFLVIK